MSKRFTDTDKWKKPFIRGLEGPYKLLWLYILDDCDHAGIWQVDFEVAQIRIGEPIDQNQAIKIFGDRIEIFNGGSKWFIKDFVDFQYGQLNEKNRLHLSVINILTKNKVGAYKGLIRSQGQIQGKGNGQGNGEYYQNAENAYQELSQDGVLLEHIRIAIRAYWSTPSQIQLQNIVKQFIAIHGIPGGKVETEPKEEVRRHLMNWVQSKAKIIHEYAK